jgi:hypothetical protein
MARTPPSTIRIPVDLRDRVRVRAEHRTFSGAVEALGASSALR